MTGRADRIARMLALVPLGAACGVAVDVLLMVGLFLSAGARIVVAMRYIDGGIIGALPGAILGCLVAAAWLYARTARRDALA